jgi:TolA-binding protein
VEAVCAAPSPAPTRAPAAAPAAAEAKRDTAPSLEKRRDPALADEHALLERAESALRRGDWSTALRQTETYAQRFPQGQLAEENLYLALRACLAGGDDAGARARLEQLHRRFPHSGLVRSRE